MNPVKSITFGAPRRHVVWAMALAILACAALPTSNAAAEEIAVIVNPANPIANLEKSDVARLFLGRAQNFPGGAKAAVVTADDGTATRAAFEKNVLGRSESQMKAYWSKQMFSGQGSPPPTVGDDAAVKAKVASDADAVSYIPASMVDDSVKVVFKL